jgi:hypothetical protein
MTAPRDTNAFLETSGNTSGEPSLGPTMTWGASHDVQEKMLQNRNPASRENDKERTKQLQTLESVRITE